MRNRFRRFGNGHNYLYPYCAAAVQQAPCGVACGTAVRSDEHVLTFLQGVERLVGVACRRAYTDDAVVVCVPIFAAGAIVDLYRFAVALSNMNATP